MGPLIYILVILGLIYAIVVFAVYAMFVAVGLSGGKAFLVTLGFMVFGLWHPLGWVVLVLCLLAQYAERREQIAAMDKARADVSAGAPRSSAAVAYLQLTERGEYARTN